ncbi:MAG: alpha/beta hydrolase [Betaproteobacteria bacterium AqS2]|uniref:Alpha/beta hydrolase n=1 Tax=Candidatus Amphirhobacter heronislandensis TaxID=1732024 RepID=A0A930UG00_9GAMM|nr:alpha/beta hydrolase [Betaproteobacteria bacterium AqS2]
MAEDGGGPPPLLDDEHYARPPWLRPRWLETPYGRLRCALSEPPPNAKGTCIVAHGMSECIEKYYGILGRLREMGYAVAISDWRGHGLSAGYPAAAVDFLRLMDQDLKSFIDEIVKPELPPPYVGMAHSMGGCMLACCARSEYSPFSALILCAPMLGIKAFANPLIPVLARVYAALPAGLRPRSGTRKSRNNVTSDQQRYHQYASLLRRHPELRSDFDMALWSLSAKKRLDIMQANDWYAGIKIPTLVLIAGGELIIANESIEAAGRQLPAGTVHVHAGAMHELLHETDAVQELVWSQVADFLQQAAA